MNSTQEQVHALRTRAGARVLDDEVLEVRGDDRAKWLTGMVTNQVQDIAPGRAVYTGIVNVKGKLLCDAWVLAQPKSLLLVLPHGTRAQVEAHFNHYIVMEDVELVAIDTVRVVSIQGPSAASLVEGQSFWPVDRLGVGGIDVLIPRDATLETVLRDVPLVSPMAWDIVRISNGRPAWGKDFDANNFVQEANITARAVSFNKGCYVGQETVCRLEMRGQVKRQLALLELDVAQVQPSEHVYAGDLDVGMVTSSVELDGRSMALAMMKTDALRDAHEFRVGEGVARLRTQPG